MKNDPLQVICSVLCKVFISIRAWAGSALIAPNALWITGGEDPQPTGTSEVVQLNNGSLLVFPGPNLPIEVLGHCIIALNDTEVPHREKMFMMIGGYNPYMLDTSRTFFFSERSGWTEGPGLITPRRAHACGLLNVNDTNERFVIVTGGVSERSSRRPHQSTEFLNLDHIDNGWIPGPDLQKPLYAHSMVSTGDSIFVLGGIEGEYVATENEEIFEFVYSNGLGWRKMDQKLNNGRSNMVAMMIPDYLANCVNWMKLPSWKRNSCLKLLNQV